ncbi:MAG: 16S rRNA (uracil(1498)-N(3))-methyltransferase [Desulfobacterales bacterium]|jgi:16S rRNA (uracil1498-N3)-methyltransferase|nr:16S rRNA (uracil(1498)-N(3))-methyltransferase [Desulfobacterales bacterium]
MRRFLIHPSEIKKQSPLIQGSDVLHIRKVLRLKPGDRILLLDGEGNEYEAVIDGIFDDCIRVDIIKQYQSQTEPPIRIIVMQAFLKEKKMDMLIRALTEVGISAWMPVFTEHSIPRPDEKRQASRTERWKEIAKESIKQCRRSVPPEILSPATFHQAIHANMDADLKIIFWENEMLPLRGKIAPDSKKISDIIILLGPEGGFSRKEIDLATSADFVGASLGPRILKAETASIAACVLIQHIYGDMG